MRALTVLTARVGLLLITIVTFITSFDAVSEVAVELQAVAPNLGWTIPLALDGLIVVGSAVLWSESLEDRWHLFPLVTVIAASVLSVTANIAHAGTDDLLGQALAGVPPVALILAVELAAWQIRRSMRRQGKIGEMALKAEAAAVAARNAASNPAPTAPEPVAVPAYAAQAPVPATASNGGAVVTRRVEPPNGAHAAGSVLHEHDDVTPPPRPRARTVDADGLPVDPADQRTESLEEQTGPLRVPRRSGPEAVEHDRQLWERIQDLVRDQPSRPSEAAIAKALGESRSAVRRTIASHREEWDRLATASPADNGKR